MYRKSLFCISALITLICAAPSARADNPPGLSLWAQLNEAGESVEVRFSSCQGFPSDAVVRRGAGREVEILPDLQEYSRGVEQETYTSCYGESLWWDEDGDGIEEEHPHCASCTRFSFTDECVPAGELTYEIPGYSSMNTDPFTTIEVPENMACPEAMNELDGEASGCSMAPRGPQTFLGLVIFGVGAFFFWSSRKRRPTP